MRRLHVAEVALGVTAVASGALLWALIDFTRSAQGFAWSENPTQEQMLAMAVSQMTWILSPVLGFAVAACVLGLVFVWCFAAPRQPISATRTMSAAGSTVKRTAVTSPNSSPSISNSWGSPSTTSSTERPRE